MSRYAWGTTVAVEKSRAELMTLLAKHGVHTFAMGSSPSGEVLQFEVNGIQFRFSVPVPDRASLAKMGDYDGIASRYGWDEAVRREHRRRWRAHLMLLKMKLEFVESGDTSIEREFMAWAVLPTGQTIGDSVASGGLPMLGAGR